MPLPDRLQRRASVTQDHVDAFRKGFTSQPLADGILPVEAGAIDDVAGRFGDTYLWHMEPGSAHRDSRLLRLRMDDAGIDPTARLAHGVMGLIHALRVAFLDDPNLAIRGVENVRFSAPVFEGASLTASVEEAREGASGFVITTDQLEPRIAITGRILYGEVPGIYDYTSFISHPAQQLFSLEECLGLLSALVGVEVEESGARVLYMGQRLELQELVSLGDELEATAEIVDRQEGRQTGERTTARVEIVAQRDGERMAIAAGESMFLYMA